LFVVLTIVLAMPSRAAQALSDVTELDRRLARMRQLCEDLDRAVLAADQQRERIGQMKQDADDVYNALTAETLAPVPLLLPLPRPRRLP
jgi:hypothetical protein